MLLATLFLILHSTMGSIASQVCKCIPGSPCFPSQEELDLLSSNLSHPLVVGQRPFASVCYNSAAGYDSLACQEATANQFSIEIRAASSNTLQWVNFEDYITTSTVQQCPFNQTNGDLCYQGRVPSYAINVTTVEDIQATIRFASKYNLRLVVKNTGHELMGRPFGIGAIELFMHHMKGTNFTDNFVPIGTAADDTDSQPAVTIGPGVQWADLYLAAQEHNRSVAGGFVPHGTVGAGAGWPMGGGHSPLSPFFGLGVDNVLQYTVVLPNASHVVANQYIHPDLFWALRGGGGPSFGVATSLTYRTHPNYPYTGAFYVASAHSSTSFHALLALWVKHHNDVADAGWAGTWPWSNNTLYLTLLAQGLPATQTANTTLEAFFAASRALPGVNVSLALTVPYTSFYEFYFDNLVDGSLGFGMNYTAGEQGGINQATSSWLVPREIYDTNSSTLADALANMPSGSAFLVGGLAVSQVNPNATAVTPAWRRTISDIVIDTSWESTSDPTVIANIRQNVYDQIEPLRKLAPVPYGGQYLNEPDILEVNWQGAYWGSNYPRLLSIKRQIDPDDLLIVQKGVNSEDWDHEIICKTV